MPTVAFKTLGCRLNQAETAAMRSRFDLAGFKTVDFGAPCDVAVIHTCTITRAAERDCSKYARYARRRGAARVVLAGCAVERDAEAVQSASGADLVVGQAAKLELPARLGLAGTTTTPAPSPADTPVVPAFDSTRALLKVQDGCAFRCAYCIVPDTRGIPRSRPATEILQEARLMVEQGHRALVLTGANLGCYHDGKHRLPDLLEQLEQIDSLARIRIGSIESSTVEHEVIAHMARSRKLCNFLHLPLQSGSDSVLQRMGRRYRQADYEATIAHAATTLQPLGLGTDIITGFPGETDAEFEQTLALVSRLPFNNLHVFPYSERPGTPAATMPDVVPHALRRERAARLIALGNQKRTRWLKDQVGRSVRIVVEQRDNTTHRCEGWSDTYARCRITSPTHALGDLIEATVHALEASTLLLQL